MEERDIVGGVVSFFLVALGGGLFARWAENPGSMNVAVMVGALVLAALGVGLLAYTFSQR